MLSFPPGFLWASATAPQQVEGQNFNSDWSEWEQLPGKIKHGDNSRVACDWWGGGRWREDFDRAASLGMNAQRIGIEWARIEPREGEWDGEAVLRYRAMLTGLRERGMEPFVTLHHFSSPRWVAARGGFENPDLPQWMARYAERAVREFGDLVTYWITLNEPNGYARQCYLEGVWLAQKKNLGTMLAVMRTEIRAHAAMYHAIKRVKPAAQVGFAIHYRAFEPLNPQSPLDRFVAALRNRIINDSFTLAVEQGTLKLPLGLNTPIPEAQGTQDFLGVNYYYQENSAFDLTNAAEGFGRSVYDPDQQRLAEYFEGTGNLRPGSLQALLVRLGKYHKPIYITENGFVETDRDDQTRYLISHLRAVHQAIQQGADVRGYFWWTLLDNFEWSEGYVPRFGLYHLDLETQVRTLRRAGEVYQSIAHANGIPDALLEAYP